MRRHCGGKQQGRGKRDVFWLPVEDALALQCCEQQWSLKDRDAEDDSPIPMPPGRLLRLAEEPCDWNGHLCPLVMLSKCQALMRFPTLLRDTSEVCATHSKPPAWLH